MIRSSNDSCLVNLCFYANNVHTTIEKTNLINRSEPKYCLPLTFNHVSKVFIFLWSTINHLHAIGKGILQTWDPVQTVHLQFSKHSL